MDHRMMVTFNVTDDCARNGSNEKFRENGNNYPEIVEELIYEKMRERRDPSAPTETP